MRNRFLPVSFFEKITAFTNLFYSRALYIIEVDFISRNERRTRWIRDFFLIQKMKNGDDSAIENFVRKYYPKIFQYCLLHIRDRGDAEESDPGNFPEIFPVL